MDRTIPFFTERIVPEAVDQGKRVLISSSENAIRGLLMHLLDTKSSRKVRLFFGVRHESDLFYTDLYRGLSAKYPEFSYDITLSSPNPETWAGHRGRVTDLIEKLIQPADAQITEAYLCGGQQMIDDAKVRLMAKGFPEEAIHHENFY